MRALALTLLVGLLGLVAAAPSAFASDPAPAADDVDVARRVNDLAGELQSPFCPGKTLLTCTSTQAYDLRREIRDLITQGKSDQEIIALLEGRFGEEIANPPQPWYTFLIPFIPFVAGAALIIWAVRRWRRRPAPTPPPVASVDALSPEDAERLARLRRQIGQGLEDT